MSYDLLAWKAPTVTDVDAFHDLLARYDDGDISAFDASDKVLAFYDELLAAYPPLESYDEDQFDVVPTSWSMTPDRSDRLITMYMQWPTADDIGPAIVDLASKHGLMVYDPQGPDVYPPDDRSAVQPRATPFRNLLGPLGGLAFGAAAIYVGMREPTGIQAMSLVAFGVVFAGFSILLIVLRMRGISAD